MNTTTKMPEIVCCTCLSDFTPDMPYYKLDSDPTSTNEIHLKEKLLYYVPEFEEVLSDYGEEAWICRICCEALCWGYNFRKMCLEVKSKFKDIKNILDVEIKDDKIDIEEMSLSGLKTELFDVDEASINSDLTETERPMYNEKCNLTANDKSPRKSTESPFCNEGNVSINLMDKNHHAIATDNSLKNHNKSLLLELGEDKKKTRKRGRPKKKVGFFSKRTELTENITDYDNAKKKVCSSGHQKETNRGNELRTETVKTLESYFIYKVETRLQNTVEAQPAKKPRKRGRPKKRVGFFKKHISSTDDKYTQRKNYMEKREGRCIENYYLRQISSNEIQKETFNVPSKKQASENVDVARKGK